MLDAIGWIGSAMLAVCGLPQLVKTLRTRQANDISWAFLSLWGGGDLCLFIYVLPTGNLPLLVNYGLNAAIIAAIVYVKSTNQPTKE